MLEQTIKNERTLKSYRAWLQYDKIEDIDRKLYLKWFTAIGVATDTKITKSAVNEIIWAAESMLEKTPDINEETLDRTSIILGTYRHIHLEEYGLSSDLLEDVNEEGYVIKTVNNNEKQQILLIGKTDKGILYATYHLLRLIQTKASLEDLHIKDAPKNQFRMINQWDNIDGSIERGYAGNSIFYVNDNITDNLERVKDYARLLSSIGMNAISINNVNVWDEETNIITEKYLPKVKNIAEVFRAYGITIYLSINYASPIVLGSLETADPLDENVQNWWKQKVAEIYKYIPDFGGFVVKADSENRPGPFSYGRNHADGANVLAEALKPFNGIVIWRCFVYNNLQDWRDKETDRARAAYDHFTPIDGEFLDNVILQIKNGPMDFQVREGISPLLGALKKTNQFIELQVTQEYTGQQKDVCYLVPQWKEILEFDTYAKGQGTKIKDIVNGSVFKNNYSGIAAVSNIGNDINWTGHTLAQANLYGYGRLTWNPDLTTEEITKEWIYLTFGQNDQVVENITYILLNSWKTYENYTAPLGVGWMVNPGHHYGPNVDGYEYSKWGTYHFADCHGIGVDRTVETGTGYTSQYFPQNAETFNSLETCPDELLLFFHHVPYTYVLHSGETVIQHIYNTHFEGVEELKEFIQKWNDLDGLIDKVIFENVKERFHMQLENAKEWRDQINTYFYRKSGISDDKNRKIY